MTNTLVSVIIPTYNRAALIRTAVDSVVQQTYKPVEIVVVDDGSTDNTLEVLKKYGNRLRIIRQSNAGPAVARNRGIDLANGRFIAFLDSDDYWLPDKLTRQVEALETAGDCAPCCICNCTVRYADGRTTSTFTIADTWPRHSVGLWTNPAEVLMDRFLLFNQAVLIRRDALDRTGYFNEDLRFGEDYDLPLRLSLNGPWAILRDELVVYHDSSPGSWAQRAMIEEKRLREDLVLMRARILRHIGSSETQAKLHWIARRELRREVRRLHACMVGSGSGPGSVVFGRILRLAERLRRGALRRSPLYPRVHVLPFDNATVSGLGE